MEAAAKRGDQISASPPPLSSSFLIRRKKSQECVSITLTCFPRVSITYHDTTPPLLTWMALPWVEEGGEWPREKMMVSVPPPPKSGWTRKIGRKVEILVVPILSSFNLVFSKSPCASSLLPPCHFAFSFCFCNFEII